MGAANHVDKDVVLELEFLGLTQANVASVFNNDESIQRRICGEVPVLLFFVTKSELPLAFYVSQVLLLAPAVLHNILLVCKVSFTGGFEGVDLNPTPLPPSSLLLIDSISLPN